MDTVLHRYGYAALFLGVALEGEAALVAAALLAHRGFLRLPLVISVAVAANSCADQLLFQLARHRGRGWLEHRFGRNPRYVQLVELVRRRGGALLVASRFTYGLRVAIPAACGVCGMGVVWFTLLDLAAGLLWAVPLAVVSSRAAVVHPLLGAVVGGGAVIAGVHAARGRLRRGRAEACPVVEASASAVERAVREHGRHSLASLATASDKRHVAVAEGRGVIAYAVCGGVAFAAGDPLCSEGDLEGAMREWTAHCLTRGLTPCVYEAAEEHVGTYARLGLRSLKMAEEAIVDLPGFGLAGGKRAGLRAMVHRAERASAEVRRDDRAAGAVPELDQALAEISASWLEGRRHGEMGFSLGRFSLDALDEAFVFVGYERGAATAFATFRPYRGGRAALLDLIRRRNGAAPGTMDLLVARALEELRGLGLEEASLANAPLACVGARNGGLERALSFAFRRAGRVYGYRSLFQFKKKFAPRWEGRYLVYRRASDLPRVALALAFLHRAQRGSSSPRSSPNLSAIR